MPGSIQLKMKGGPEDESLVQEWHQSLVLCKVPKKRKQTRNNILTVSPCRFILAIYRLILATGEEKFQKEKDQADTLPWRKAYVSHVSNVFLVFSGFFNSQLYRNQIASPAEQLHLK